MKTERRTALKKIFASAAGLVGFGIAARAKAPEEKTVSEVINFQEVPLISRSTKYENLLFLTGRGGYGAEPFTIENHTKIALDLLEEELINRGSSMEKVLQVTVLIDDMANFNGMNTAYKGRFGAKPPARTTIAVAKGGLPGNNGKSLVEIDCIAYI
jgi:enamine deaminase RidA (YjgF/YER057c/UK114 family)